MGSMLVASAVASLAAGLNGTLFAASAEEYVAQTAWVPASDCAPACATNTTCCKDPPSGQAQGLCMNTLDCSKVLDTNITLAQKLLRFDLKNGVTTQSAGVPMAAHSGVTLQTVVLPTGELLLHEIFIVDGGMSIQLLRWAPGDASTPPSLAGQCRLGQKITP